MGQHKCLQLTQSDVELIPQSCLYPPEALVSRMPDDQKADTSGIRMVSITVGPGFSWFLRAMKFCLASARSHNKPLFIKVPSIEDND